ncbi:hypothetical protein ACPPVS_05785 [Cellulomonas sp. McL0617]|uniref:hypothetical protein n=1 Tax=Cellulomonas sp. McL0617 TaxID=3415675 RepID=UPI003CF843AA
MSSTQTHLQEMPSPTATTTGTAALWRILAALAIAHVLVMFGSFGLQKVAPLGAPRDVVIADHVTHAAPRGLAGLCLTLAAFLLLLVAATLLGRLLRGTTELSGWLASTIAAAGAVYVGISVVGELAPLAAALYGGQHGAGVDVVVALVQLHWFALYGATGVLGVFTLAVAGAVLATRALPRWVAWTGLVVGAVCLAGVPGAGAGLADTATAVWSVWFVGLGVAAARAPRAGRVPAAA